MVAPNPPKAQATHGFIGPGANAADSKVPQRLFFRPQIHVLRGYDMELLVYVRNHGGRREGTKYVGASVGDSPGIETLGSRAPLTSSAEFRIDARVEDPIEELMDAVEQVFAMLGTPGRPVYVTRPRSAIRVQLEPGFDTPTEVARDLAEMLAMCSPKVPARPHIASPEHAAAQ